MMRSRLIRRRDVRAVLLAALFVALAGSRPAAARLAINTQRSRVAVHVFKSGLFRAFGDNHDVEAPVKGGWIDEGSTAGVQLVVEASQLRVLDPGLSAGDREQVQARMVGPDVLDVARFPEIRFESTTVQRTRDAWSVDGQLTLHGQTGRVLVKVVRDHGHYRGTAWLKQTAFGITPVSVAGGTVKVKDEISIEFDIVARPSTAGA